MFKNEYPIFIHKNILKIEMLENMRDYPRDIFDIFYKDYSDGILTGCEIEVQKGYLLLHPGIILYHQKIYCSKEYEKIPYSAKECQMYLKIKFFDKNNETEKVRYFTQILLDGEKTNETDEIELCRFYLQEGARLREDYQDFADFSTAYNTINRIYVPYASRGKSTLWPYLLEYFAKKTMKKKHLEIMDIVFCMSVLNEKEAVSRETIIAYIENKTQKEAGNLKNHELYSELLELLENSSYEENSKELRKTKPYKILLD